ncbi:hypothetical protein GQX74_006106 [Glossina fuscipes]|nr:hypothetical protein GQX74_006106 [Glossina fuscipes]
MRSPVPARSSLDVHVVAAHRARNLSRSHSRLTHPSRSRSNSRFHSRLRPPSRPPSERSTLIPPIWITSPTNSRFRTFLT